MLFAGFLINEKNNENRNFEILIFASILLLWSRLCIFS